MTDFGEAALVVSIDDETILKALDKQEEMMRQKAAGDIKKLSYHVFFKKTLPAHPCSLAYIYATHPKCKGLGVIGTFAPVFSIKKMPSHVLWEGYKRRSLWEMPRFDEYFKNCKRGGVAVAMKDLHIFDEVLPIIGTPPRGFAYCKKNNYVFKECLK